MAKTADTARMAEINDPAPKHPQTRHGLPPEWRTVAPTPEAVKAQARSDDDGMADAERKATTEDAAQSRTNEDRDGVDANSRAEAAGHQFADHLSEAARSIQGEDLTRLAEDLSAFVRRQPLLFLGGAVLLGYAAGRMANGSARVEHEPGAASSHDQQVS